MTPSVIRAICRSAGILCLTAVGTGAAAILASVSWVLGPGADWRPRLLRAWARGVCAVAGIRLHVRGTVPHGPCLVVSNHQGYLDIVVLGAAIPAVFVAKSEVARWPLLGWASRAAGTVFIRRASRRHLPDALSGIARVLAGGGAVIVFPEGTSSDGSRVLPFRSAVIEPALAGGYPIAYAALGYVTRDGDPPAASAVCWWGDMTLVSHIWKLMTLRSVDAHVAFGIHGVGTDGQPRHLVAAVLHWEVSRAHAALCG